jgi:hypothetical protein
MDKPVSDLMFDQYAVLAKDLIGPLLDLMVAVRTHFGGDLDRFIIFLLIALRTAEHPKAAAIDPHAVRRGEVESYPSLFTNVRSISASTQIPYETVRRKVAKLIDAGVVERRDEYLTITVGASFAFRGVRETLFAMVENNHDVVAALLAMRERSKK